MIHENVPPLRRLHPFPLIAGLPANWYYTYQVGICRTAGPSPAPAVHSYVLCLALLLTSVSTPPATLPAASSGYVVRLAMGIPFRLIVVTPASVLNCTL